MKRLCVFLALVAFVGVNFLQAQTVQITGTVTSAEDGMPIPGVSVMVKGTTIGVATDIDGKYALPVPQASTTLVFSFVGMLTQEVEIAGRTIINVILESDATELEEVIVLGYARRGKNQITGSTVQVQAEAIQNIPVVSVDQTLQGKVPGLVMSTSSGTPGSIQDIRIRGVGSFGVAGAGNEPLIVIDGVPMVSGDLSGDGDQRSTLTALSSLNNDDVESITVLKDASATSAYGARGSNGVIVITTKKGKNQPTKFNLSVFHGFQNKASNGHDVLTGAQREELFLESLYNTYGAQYGFNKEDTYQYFNENSPNTVAALNSWIDLGRPENSWEEAIRNKNAPTTNINVSASGGDDISTFYSSLGYNNTESIVLGSEFRRISGALNYQRNFSKKFKFSTSNTASNTLQDGAILEQSAYFASPILAKYFLSPWYPPYNDDGTPNLNVGSLYNYLYLKDHDVSYNDYSRATSNSSLEWEIIKNLKYKTLVGIDFMLIHFKSHGNRNYAQYSAVNGYTYTSIRKNYNIVAQNSLSYSYSINDHSFDVMTLVEYQENRQNFLSGSGEGFVADGLTYISSSGGNWDAGSSFYDWFNASYLGMVNYNYQGKYIADFTFRREGSSRFAQGHRFGNFWSVGAAWNLKQEEFLIGVDLINTLRLRASYGISGNSDINLNQYQALLGYDADYGGLGAVYPTGYGNNFLTWEKNKNYDTGIDFGILSNRITGSFSYFNRNTFDQLYSVPLSATSGHTSIIRNVGEVINKGFESIVNFGIVNSKDFNINLSINFATLKNEVLDLAKDGEGEYIIIETGTRKIEVGQPIYAWFMRKYAGVNPETGRPQWYLNGIDGEITENYSEAEKAYQGGSATPTYSGGASLYVDYKGIYFSSNIYFAGGHKVFEDWAYYTQHAGFYPTAYYQGSTVLMDRWQKPGDITDVPIQVYNGTGNDASSTSTRFLFDGDYIRVKDIVLGYKLPKSIVSKIGVDVASVYLRGTNLLTYVFDERLKYDPEVRADGFTNLTNPPIKSVSIGLNLNF